MSEHRTPKDLLLDVLVYGPTGLALTAAEEFPHLADKGRHRIEGQVHTARLVGQFAVQMGRRQVESMLSDLLPGSAATTGPPASSRGGTGEDKPVTVPPSRPPVPPAPEGADIVDIGGVRDNGVLASEALGIPGYDSLSASQVVQRLGGLSGRELEAVRDHEQSHRHRRTILNRVEQLLGSESDGG